MQKSTGRLGLDAMRKPSGTGGIVAGQAGLQFAELAPESLQGSLLRQMEGGGHGEGWTLATRGSWETFALSTCGRYQ